ncbi:MAG: anti-sigma regulatory factor [Synergistales bacterium]|nr:anti-sigma regulatory factor [Synergistales bacterium]
MNSPYELEFSVAGEDFLAAGEGSNRVKETLKMLGIASDFCRRASIITYEAEMNLVIHARGGTVHVEICPEQLVLTTIDEGPGIEDVELAMQEGYSTAPDHIREMGFGAGMGLSNIKRNADDLAIDSRPGEGTTLRAVVRFAQGKGGIA